MKEFFGIHEVGQRLYVGESGFGEGRIQVSGSTVIPHYQGTDHLGSVRVVLTNKTSSGVTARNDYCAYGKRHANSRLSILIGDSNRSSSTAKKRILSYAKIEKYVYEDGGR